MSWMTFWRGGSGCLVRRHGLIGDDAVRDPDRDACRIGLFRLALHCAAPARIFCLYHRNVRSRLGLCAPGPAARRDTALRAGILNRLRVLRCPLWFDWIQTPRISTSTFCRLGCDYSPPRIGIHGLRAIPPTQCALEEWHEDHECQSEEDCNHTQDDRKWTLIFEEFESNRTKEGTVGHEDD